MATPDRKGPRRSGTVFPATAPLVGLDQRVRIRIGNLSTTNSHPIHLHGFAFKVPGD